MFVTGSMQDHDQAVLRRTVLLGMLSLAGCSSSAIVFDPTNLARVQRVGVLTPGFPERPDVAVLPPTNGALFLLVGAILEGNRSREFADFITRSKTDPEGEFSKALIARLRASGMKPLLVSANARRTALLKDYSTSNGQSIDAVLDIVITKYGYYAVTNAAPFKPTVVMQVRLVDLPTSNVLMQDTVNMVNIAPTTSGTTTASFENYSDIAADPAMAVQSLMAALDVAAETVCKRFA